MRAASCGSLPVLAWIALLWPGVSGHAASAPAPVTIADAVYEGRAHFKIEAAGAIWFYDKAGGGFSRLIDQEGRDWIAFRKEPLSELPASAAAGFRGLPNLVFGRDNPESGAGHPGFDHCTSERIGSDAIRTRSKSGKWQWSWRFTATHAELTLERADATRPWWFLYEGPPAGRFAPREQYWGTSDGGPRHTAPDHKARQPATGDWRWAYFGDPAVARVLFVAQAGEDEVADTFSYMGSTAAGIESPDGMVVFGFGRSGARPRLHGAGARFLVGFCEFRVTDAAGHARVARVIETLLSL